MRRRAIDAGHSSSSGPSRIVPRLCAAASKGQATVITVSLYCFFREVRASGGFPRILAKLFHDLPGSAGRHSHTSTHAPPTSPAMRSGAMRTAALVAPAAGTTSPKARSETSQ